MPLHGLKNVVNAINDHVDTYNDNVKAIYIQTLTATVKGSPVHFEDGGRLRNGWFLSVGSPMTGSRGADAGGAGSLADLGGMPEIVLGKKIYYTNVMPYANTVEYGGYPKNPKKGTYTGGGATGYQNLSRRGFSIQAPSGMVRINLNKARKKLKRL